MPSPPTEINARNRRAWTLFAERYVAPAERAWASAEPTWGIWGLPESQLRLLPDDMRGLRAIELGCGAAYVSAWMARRGAEVVGVDPTPAQLDTARGMMARFGPTFPLVEAFAEELPFPDASFDFAISEYGACLWADPERWVREAARVLRPGAPLVFLTNSVFLTVCGPELESQPSTDRLMRPYLGLSRLEWPDGQGEVEFHRTHGAWIALLRQAGFVVERLEELGAPPGATSRYPWADADWAQRWPTEDVWVARRGATG